MQFDAASLATKARDDPGYLLQCDTTAATISCRAWASYDGGDHLIFIGEIIDVQLAGSAPLLFHRSAFKGIGASLGASAWLGCSDDPSTGWFDADTAFTPLHDLSAATAN